MASNRRRKILAGLAGLAAVATPVAITQFDGPATASGPDTIQYVQTTGNGGTYIEYVPGNGSTPTSQSVTGSGGCATPTVHGTPILGFSALLYPNTDYSGSPTAAIVGAYKQRTGVCAIPQAWAIENMEALDFSVGSNTLVAGRIFSRAQIEVQREDKAAVASDTVQLVEYLSGSQVASQLCSINGPAGTALLTDTNTSVAGATCVGQDATSTGFDTIEIRVLTTTGSVSVVGPTSVFTLANEICGGQTINTASTDGSATSGQVSVSLTLLGPNTTCKWYTDFQSSANDVEPATGTTKSIVFDSQALNGTQFTVTIDWGNETFCRPDSDGAPACPPTLVSFDGVNFSPQTYCSVATAADPLCTTAKNFNYVTINNVTYTHVTETWSGINDWAFRG